MKMRLMPSISLFLFVSLFFNAIGQNNYLFIEPNISLSYDTTLFTIKEYYTNTLYKTEAYSFTSNQSSSSLLIYISGDHPEIESLQKNIDSTMTLRIRELQNVTLDSISIIEVDSVVRIIQGFSCIGMIGSVEGNDEKPTVIHCRHSSEDDNTDLNLTSVDHDLEDLYMILTTFLKELKTYSAQSILDEHNLISNMYTVQIIPNPELLGKFPYTRSTFVGTINIEQTLKHQIAEARVDTRWGEQVFFPDENGEIIIYTEDKKEGSIAKSGNLVILNSFGKKVLLPFSFTYQNNVQR
jgi:hypothetical protein